MSKQEALVRIPKEVLELLEDLRRHARTDVLDILTVPFSLPRSDASSQVLPWWTGA